MDGISRSRGWDKEIPHCVLPMEQLVLSDTWARKHYSTKLIIEIHSVDPDKTAPIRSYRSSLT